MSVHKCVCGHYSVDHTEQHPVWFGISVCLIRGFGFLGLSRCSCFGFQAVTEQEKS